jgi:probable F420-dependent oxidoreductase
MGLPRRLTPVPPVKVEQGVGTRPVHLANGEPPPPVAAVPRPMANTGGLARRGRRRPSVRAHDTMGRRAQADWEDVTDGRISAMAPHGPVRTRAPRLSAFGTARTLRAMYDLGGRVKEAGFDAFWVPEGSQDVFSMCAAASLGCSQLALGTSVAVAFARSPMITAQAAWTLAQATDGQFTVGLGTQVRAHVERRYSAPFAHPGPRMREYVEAVRAIFAAFRGVEKLKFDGTYYSFSLLAPTWSPGPMEHPDPSLFVAGVRPWMCQMIGETADGMLVHPLDSARYIEQIVRPAVRRGEQAAHRPPGSVSMIYPIMTAVSDDDEVRERQRHQIRARLAFYGSTPGYGVVFDASGYPGLGEQLNALQRQGRVEQMPDLVTDDILDDFAITCTWDDLPRRLHDRLGDLADGIVCYSALEYWDDHEDAMGRWQDVNRRFDAMARAAR